MKSNVILFSNVSPENADQTPDHEELSIGELINYGFELVRINRFRVQFLFLYCNTKSMDSIL
jgi:hypothetical protein